MAQARRWVFTLQPGHLLNGDTLDQWETRVRAMDLTQVKYLVFQQEIGEEQSGHHIQGYIHFAGVKRATTLATMFGCKPEAFQMSRGSPQDNKNYCTKDETRKAGCTFFEHGSVPPEERSRSDLKRACEVLKDDGMEALIEELPHTFAQYPRGMEALNAHYQSKRLKTVHRTVQVYVLWGDPGSGKSYWAQNFKPGDSYTLPVSRKGSETWFNNYQGEKVLIIEDFAGKIDYRSMLQILDNYPIQVQIKGGHVWAEWDYVLITSNFDPQTWYHIDDGDYWDADHTRPGPLQRRIDHVINFRGVWPTNTIYLQAEGITLDNLPDWATMNATAELNREVDQENADASVRSDTESEGDLHQPFEPTGQPDGQTWDALDVLAQEEDILAELGLTKNQWEDIETDVI